MTKFPPYKTLTIYPQLCCHLTHRGRVTHTCVSKLTIIGSDNGLSPGRRQAIIWTNDGILLIGPLGTNFSEIWSKIHTFSFKKMHLKTSSAKWRPFCLGLNVLTVYPHLCCHLSAPQIAGNHTRPYGIINPKYHCYANGVLQYVFPFLKAIEILWKLLVFKASNMEGSVSKLLINSACNALESQIVN